MQESASPRLLQFVQGYVRQHFSLLVILAYVVVSMAVKSILSIAAGRAGKLNPAPFLGEIWR